MDWSNLSKQYKTDRASFSIWAQFLSDSVSARDVYYTEGDMRVLNTAIPQTK